MPTGVPTQADGNIWYTDGRERLVRPGHPDAAFLGYTKGDPILQHDLAKLPPEDVPTDDETAGEPKMRTPRANKARVAGEDK